MNRLKIFMLCTMGFGMILAQGEAQVPPFVDADGDGINDALQGMHRVRGRVRGGGDWSTALSKLKLPPDQRARLKQASRDYQKTVDPINTAIGTAQARLKGAMEAAQPDQKTIDTHIDAISAMRTLLQKADVAYRMTVQGILTPEQWMALNTASGELKAGAGARATKKGGFDIFVDEDGDGICDGRGIGRKPPPPGPEEHRQGQGHPGK